MTAVATTTAPSATKPAPRYPLKEYWEDRWVTGADVRRMINELDPVENDAEITHLSLEVLVPPMFVHAAYAAGTARGLGHPAEAAAGYRGGTGEQLLRPTHRDRDTLTFFGLFMRDGWRSPESQAIFDRVQQIHYDVKGVGNETQVHVLALLSFEPERYVRDLGLPQFFSPRENEARYHFWQGVGKGMGLKNVPDTYESFQQWLAEWEPKHFVPTRDAAEVYLGQIKGFETYFPGPFKPLAKEMLTAGLSGPTRRVVGQTGKHRLGRALDRAAMTAAYYSSPVRRFNLSRTLVTSFSRDGNNPNIHEIGYQHDHAHDNRYLKVGDPADGYHYTVRDGVQSGAPS